MKTNIKISKEAFSEWFNCYMEWRNYEEQIQELYAIAINNDYRFYADFMRSRRIKAHSFAFYAVILAVKPFMPSGYYLSNPQAKKFIKEFFNIDYKEFLKPLVEMLENERNEQLEG